MGCSAPAAASQPALGLARTWSGSWESFSAARSSCLIFAYFFCSQAYEPCGRGSAAPGCFETANRGDNHTLPSHALQKTLCLWAWEE